MSQAHPDSAASFARAYPGISVGPTALWPCQDASGGAADVLGDNHLSVETGGPGYQQEGEGGRFAIAMNSFTRLAHPSEGFLDIGNLSNPITIWARVTLTEDLSLARGLMGNGGSFNMSFESTVPPGRLRGILSGDSGSNEARMDPSIDHAPGTHNFALSVDPATGLYHVASSLGMLTEAIGSLGDMSSAPGEVFGLGAWPGVRAVQNFLYHIGAAWDGYALTPPELFELIAGGIPVAGPEISNVTAPGEITRTTPLVFDVTDDAGLRRVLPSILFPGRPPELAHDGESFTVGYVDDSTRTAIAGGYRYSLLRRGGWPAPPTLRVYALDTHGNEAP